MKIMSDNAVTKSDLTAIDEKHTDGFHKIKVALVLCTLANLAVSLALKFLC